MRAEINENGVLSVRGESPLEMYALKQWFDGWNKPEEQQTSVLLIDTTKQYKPDQYENFRIGHT